MGHRQVSRALFASLLLPLLGWSSGALAAPPPVTEAPKQPGHVYSPYEKETLAAALLKHRAEVDPAPEGKLIEGIDIERLEVVEDRDPVPNWLNVFHATTKDYVVRRELLVAVGDPWVQALVDETARNLYAVPKTTSIVICEAVKGSGPGRVRLLVVTKDVWSLRAAWNLGIGKGGLEDLVLQPTETNVAGTHQTVLANFHYQPLSYTLGAAYLNPRLDGRRLVLSANANVVLSRETGRPEGSAGSLNVNRPLYSALAEWGYGVNTLWDNHVFRHYRDAQLVAFSNAARTAQIPDQFRTRSFRETAAVTRSFGWATKDDFSFGGEINKRNALVENPGLYDPTLLDTYRRARVPTNDTRVGPFVQWRHYSSDYIHVFDFETFALQEAYRLGPDLWLRLYPVFEPLGSSRTFFGTYAAAQDTVRLGGGLLRAYVESVTEPQADKLADAAVDGGAHWVSPRAGFGRFVVDAGGLYRYRNYMNRTSPLGGETRLRGYPSGFLVGKDLLEASAEFRTVPVEILSCQLGFVAFYDGGDAFDAAAAKGSTDRFQWLQSVGGGLRALFPQLDRSVFRADIGFPLVRPTGAGAVSFYIAFGQAFDLATVGDSSAQGLPSTVGALGQ